MGKTAGSVQPVQSFLVQDASAADPAALRAGVLSPNQSIVMNRLPAQGPVWAQQPLGMIGGESYVQPADVGGRSGVGGPGGQSGVEFVNGIVEQDSYGDDRTARLQSQRQLLDSRDRLTTA